jgi:hypothetical protein
MNDDIDADDFVARDRRSKLWRVAVTIPLMAGMALFWLPDQSRRMAAGRRSVYSDCAVIDADLRNGALAKAAVAMSLAERHWNPEAGRLGGPCDSRLIQALDVWYPNPGEGAAALATLQKRVLEASACEDKIRLERRIRWVSGPADAKDAWEGLTSGIRDGAGACVDALAASGEADRRFCSKALVAGACWGFGWDFGATLY